MVHINDSTETVEKRMQLLEEHSDVLDDAYDYCESHPEMIQMMFDDQMEMLENVIRELIAAKTKRSKK